MRISDWSSDVCSSDLLKVGKLQVLIWNRIRSDPMTPQSLDMITKLVGFDTVSRNSNMQLIDYVRDYLAGYGVDSHLVKSKDGKKSNLFATVGPNVEGGVGFSSAGRRVGKEGVS